MPLRAILVSVVICYQKSDVNFYWSSKIIILFFPDFSGLSLENGRPKDEYSATPSGSTSAGSSVGIDVDNPAGPGTVQHPPHPPQYSLPGSQAVGGE